jgi:hypothetical protein
MMSRREPPGLVDDVRNRCTAGRRVLVCGHYDKRPWRRRGTNLPDATDGARDGGQHELA